MSVQGDFGKLRALSRKFSVGLGKSLIPRMSPKMAQAATQLVQQEFSSGQDPYGRTWARTKSGGKPLTRTGRLRQSIRASVNHAGFDFQAAGYALFHQFGTKSLPQRMIFPTSTGLPSSWKKRFIAIAQEEVRRGVG